MSERPGLKAQVAQLHAECDANSVIIEQLQTDNRALRARLGGEPESTIADVSGVVVPGERIMMLELQARSDKIAVSALIRNHLDVYAALEQLGYKVATMTKEQRDDLARRVFDNDRIREILDETMKPAEAAKDAIVQLQVQSALYGEPKQRAQAMQFLAKVGGWYQQQRRADRRNAGISFQRLVKDMPRPGPEPTVLDALDAFTHEPEASPFINALDEPLDTPVIPDEPILPWRKQFGGYPRSAQSPRATL